MAEKGVNCFSISCYALYQDCNAIKQYKLLLPRRLLRSTVISLLPVLVWLLVQTEGAAPFVQQKTVKDRLKTAFWFYMKK